MKTEHRREFEGKQADPQGTSGVWTRSVAGTGTRREAPRETTESVDDKGLGRDYTPPGVKRSCGSLLIIYVS